MKSWPVLAAALTALSVWGLAAAPAPAQPVSAAQTRTDSIVAAAQAFLTSLAPAQRQQAQFDFVAQKTATLAQFRGVFVGEKYNQAMWSNYPVSDVPRPGLTMGSLTAAQRAAVMDLLKAALSAEGYRKVVDIMGADQALSESGTPYDDGNAYYLISVHGAPSSSRPWMIQFGGHHLALNLVVDGPNVSVTPALTGDQPASYVRDGRTVRPMGQENDKGFKLMNALSLALQRKATLTYQIDNLVLGPGQDGRVLQPEGLSVAEMTPAQRALLLDLIGEWVNLLNPVDAAPRMARIKADLDKTYFAWHGATANPSPVYFRITGPTLQIEFAHQGDGGDTNRGVQAGGINHVHTVYRDPTNEYGTAWTLK